MLISILISLFSLKGSIAQAPVDNYVKQPGVARFTIRRLMYADLPNHYYELDEQQVKKIPMTARHCFERCLKDNKKKMGTCAYARIDVYTAQFEHPEVQRAPFEQRILMTRARHCWLYGAAKAGEQTTEYLAKGTVNKKTGEEGKHVIATFIVETKKVAYPPEPWHPNYPADHVEIVDDNFKAYMAEAPEFKCNDYLKEWPKMDDPEDYTTTLSVRRETDTSEMVSPARPIVTLYSYQCFGIFTQLFDRNCAERNFVKMFDIMLTKSPIDGCNAIGIGANGFAAPFKTTDETKIKGYCVMEKGCGGAEVAIGLATRPVNGRDTLMLAFGDDVDVWCYALNGV